MSNGWTPERRARQAELIKTWRPWEHSTGPKSAAGKAVVAKNAWTGGTRQALRRLSRALREQVGAIQGRYRDAELGGGPLPTEAV